jgi:hypothetical protein
MSGYDPCGGQKQFHKSLARTRVLCAGSRFGKSISAAYDVAPNLLLPDNRGWLVGETYTDAEKEFRYIFQCLYENPDKEFRDFIRANTVSVAKNAKQGQLWMKFKWGAWVEAKSADRPHQLLGEELDWIVACEGSQLQKTVHDRYVSARLSSRIGQLIFPTTPAGHDELLFPLFQKGQKDEWHYPDKNYFESVESWQFKCIDNPHYNREEYDRVAAEVEAGTYPRNWFEEQYDGLFTSHSGLIYPAFRQDIHVMDRFDIPADWKCYRAVDVGLDCPTVCLWVHVSPYGELVVTDEYYQTGADVQEHSQRIHEMTGARDVVYTVIDPAANQRTVGSPESPLLQFLKAGIPMIPGQNNVKAGIQIVNDYLRYKLADDKSFAIRPKLFIFANCTKLISEFQGYVYAQDRKGLKFDKPVKRNDHGLDALRYLCMQRPRHRREEMGEAKPHPDSFAAMYKDYQRSQYKLPERGIYACR